MAKAKSAKRDSATSHNPGQIISTDERQRMIAEAAYFRALERGFAGGDPVDDWLAAEREISRALPSPQRQKEEQAAYEKLRKDVRKVFAEVRGTATAETLRQAFEKTIDELKKTGGHTADTINTVAAALRKDLASASLKMGPKWETFTEKSADLFEVWRDRGSLFLAQAANAVGGWLQQAGTRLEQQVYHTGEMAHSGTFECMGCGERMVLGTSAHLPPCSRCRKMEFRRI